ncbi:uncharacterized protein LOC106061060 isoform X2 [Biomphalaria glabrata]|uniref:Uncharacterized protein LOC106061060 isoform X2 n=1 Tax=Biomphalaria glabrata TaxID=6526 RepID=A0A9W3BGY5_BIOGL|nr:uncharacterized protein LOC106061060 isoform X2 [Biomphalaria glabrata]
MGNVDSTLFGTHHRNSSKSSSSTVCSEHGDVLNIIGDNQQIEGSLDFTGRINLIHEGVLNIIGNGNTIKRLTFYLRQDAFGKTVIVHNDVLMVTGKGYRVTGAENFQMYYEKSYIKHKGSLRIQGNGNTILDIHIQGKFEDDLTANRYSDNIEIIGNGNVVRTVRLLNNQVVGPYDHGCHSSSGDFEFRYIDENLFDENITEAIQNYRSKKCAEVNMSRLSMFQKCEDDDPLCHNATVSNDQIQNVPLQSSLSTSSGQSKGDPSNTDACLQQCESPTSSSVTLDSNVLCQQLAHELEALKAQRLCKVCRSKDSCMTFTPCGHFVSCEDCCSKVDRCPACQSHIDNTVITIIP